MKFLILTVLLFPAANSFSQSHRLNFFPDTDAYYSVGYMYNSTTITPHSASIDSIEDTSHTLLNTYGKKIGKSEYFAMALPFTFSNRDDREFGADKRGRVDSKGFSEPTLKYGKRVKSEQHFGDFVKDISFSYSPELFDRKIGKNDGNHWNGSHRFQLETSIGAIYDYWEARIFMELSYQSEQAEENVDQDSKITYSSRSSYLLGIEFQHALSDQWFINGSTGIQFFQTYDIKNEKTENISSIQQGTGSRGYIGILYKNLNENYRLKLHRIKNDFFAENSNTSNFKGDSRIMLVEFSYLKNF